MFNVLLYSNGYEWKHHCDIYEFSQLNSRIIVHLLRRRCSSFSLSVVSHSGADKPRKLKAAALSRSRINIGILIFKKDRNAFGFISLTFCYMKLPHHLQWAPLVWSCGYETERYSAALNLFSWFWHFLCNCKDSVLFHNVTSLEHLFYIPVFRC